MIQRFGDQRTEAVWNGVNNARTRSLPPDGIKSARRKLDMLNAAVVLADLASPPGNQLEALKGDLAGWHSIRINRQWRIIFQWTDNGPAGVSIVDYH